MKITSARVIVCCPGRNFVTLKIETDEGLTGIGDATLNGRELSVVSYLAEHVIPCLIGRDPQQIEDIWQYLYKGAYWRRGPVTMSAIGAVDTALWDIKAKAANMPLYQLLGGKSRTGVMVYGHANGSDIAHTVDEVLRYKEMGYKAIRAQSGVPGLEKVYGVGRGSMFYEPADADLPSEHDWSSEKYLLHTPQLFAAVREAVGPDTHLLHDVHPVEAVRQRREQMHDVAVFGIGKAADAPDIATLWREFGLGEGRLDAVFDLIGKLGAACGEEFDSVVGRGVVRGGDHHAEVGLEVGHQKRQRGRGNHAGIEYVNAGAGQPRGDCAGQKLPGDPRVAGNDRDRTTARGPTAIGHPALTQHDGCGLGEAQRQFDREVAVR